MTQIQNPWVVTVNQVSIDREILLVQEASRETTCSSLSPLPSLTASGLWPHESMRVILLFGAER